MAAFDNTKYHIELYGVPYMIRGYRKSEQPTFIPRLGSGDQNESEFNLLKSKTVQGFAGGGLQRNFNDETSVFAVEGMFPVYDDGTLYPVNAPVAATGILPTAKNFVTAYVKSSEYVFIASRTVNTPTNYIKRIDKAGTVTTITLPASLSSASEITSMIINTDILLIVCANTSTAMWYMPITTTTVTAITAGSGTVTKMVVFKGRIYGTGGAYLNSTLWLWTGGTSARSWVQVGDTAKTTTDYSSELLVYNNRIILTRHDGLYAYDGVQLVAIEDAQDFIDTNNYRFPNKLKGYLYYFMPDGMYRFNGSLIEKMYDIAEIGMPVYAFTGKNRLWLIYNNYNLNFSRYDKSMGYDYSSGLNSDNRVMCFNGKGLFTYARTVTFVKSAGADEAEGSLVNGLWFNDKVYLFFHYSVDSEYHKTIDTNELVATGNKSWRIVTSIDDSEFPMVNKSIDNLEIVLDGNVVSDQTITVEYRSGGFDGSTGWTTLGTFSTQTALKCEVWKTIASGVVYKQIQFRFSGTTDARYGIKRLVSRYLLVPEFKWQWNFTVLCYGDDSLAPLLLVDGTEGTQAVELLRGALYAAKSSRIPCNFIDVDQLNMAADCTNSATTITLDSMVLLKGTDGFIQVGTEIMHWTSKNAYTLTVERGALNTVAAAHTNGDKVFIVYRTIIRQIQNERIELDKPESTSANKSRASEVTLVLDEV